METLIHTREIALLTIRIFLGFLFFYQGFDAVFNLGMRQVIETYRNGFNQKGIPHFITAAAALYTSYSEFISGSLLIIGLFTPVACVLLCFNLIIAAIGFGLIDPLWDLRNSLPRLLLLLTLMLLPADWDVWRLDNVFYNYL